MRGLHDTQGYTFIELLMVMIIIAILATIAIPVYLAEKEKAKDAAVKGGIHSIEVGLGSFCADHGDVYPATLGDKTVLVDAGGVSYVEAWPANPWTDADMRHGSGQGDYTYLRTGGGASFTLAGHMSTGDFVVP